MYCTIWQQWASLSAVLDRIREGNSVSHENKVEPTFDNIMIQWQKIGSTSLSI